MDETKVMLPTPTIQSWIRDYAPQDRIYNWGIVLIDDEQRFTFITENHTVIKKAITVEFLQGICIYYLLVVCNFEKQPKFIQNAILAHTTSDGSKVIPYD